MWANYFGKKLKLNLKFSYFESQEKLHTHIFDKLLHNKYNF